ncbi:MAG: MurR/RpiR family transcriptional regulator [Proteobacteria bacterium]|nr:MurR/RpiR family transcriptional regulator [Pseudomonadota bacterium]
MKKARQKTDRFSASPPEGAGQRAAGAEMPGIEVSGDILALIRAMLPEMSGNQQRVGTIFLEEPAWAVSASVLDLAARAGVSAPTIVRFARQVGCEGLRDLKLRIAGSMARATPFLHRAVHTGDSPAEVIRNVTGSMSAVLADWQRRIAPESFARAAEAIHRARRIDCLGTGATSHFLAQDLYARLFRLGLRANSFADAHFQLIAAGSMGESDVMVAISFVGRMPTLLRAVELARKRGATIIALTQADTTLARLAHILLPMDVPGDVTMLVGTDAYVVQLIAIEILMILVGQFQGPGLVRRMNETHEVLKNHSVDGADPSILHTGWRQMFEEDTARAPSPVSPGTPRRYK